MNTQTLCTALLQDACESNLAFYRNIIDDEILDAITDPLWRRVVVFARALPPEQQQILLDFARQAAIDAVSTVCGGIDGSTPLGGAYLELSLVDAEGQQHAGELQEAFLELVELAGQ